MLHNDFLHLEEPHGESLIDMQGRVFSLLREQQATYPQGKVLLITHAGVIRIGASFAAKTSLKEMFTIKLDFGK